MAKKRKRDEAEEGGVEGEMGVGIQVKINGVFCRMCVLKTDMKPAPQR